MEVLVPLALLAAGLLAGYALGRRTVRPAPQRAADDGPSDAEQDATALADALIEALPVPVLLIARDQRVLRVNGPASAELPQFAPGGDVGGVSASLAALLARVGELDGAREPLILGDPPRTYRVAVVPVEAATLVVLVDASEEVDFDEARRTFSAAVSHELRTPLARILGLAESLALPDVGDDRVELVAQIENEVDGIRKLIDEMLLLAALDRGRLAVADGVVDASAATARVVEDARLRRLGRGRDLEVVVESGIEVPVAARLYEVVVQNLVDNALLHGGPDALVDVDLRRDGETALLTVADTGVGIPPQHLPYVFQRFYRGDASRTGSGTGLGLALVKHIVEAHGGTVVAESDGGRGATFRVALPALPA